MTARDHLTEPRTDAVHASVKACSVCADTHTVDFDGRTLPCPYCRPQDARKAAS